MTSYNRKTYRVDDIEWSTTPKSTFDMQGQQTTFIEYFRKKYNKDIRDHDQPLLVSRPKKKDLHRGQLGPILLIPELCQMTGLTDEMRANNGLMKALATHLHTDPNARIAKINDFMHRLKTIPEVQSYLTFFLDRYELHSFPCKLQFNLSFTNNYFSTQIQDELRRWGLKFQDRLIEFQGRVIPAENILFGNGQHVTPTVEKYDWNHAFRGKVILFFDTIKFL